MTKRIDGVQGFGYNDGNRYGIWRRDEYINVGNDRGQVL